MTKLMNWLVRLFFPDYDEQNEVTRIQVLVDVNRVVYSAIFVVIGFAWYLSIFSPDIIFNNVIVLALMLLAMFIFVRLQFFFHFKITNEIYADVFGGFNGVIIWSSIWIFGPTAIILPVIFHLISFVAALVQGGLHSKFALWATLRNRAEGLSVDMFFALVTITIIQIIGGTVPLETVDTANILPLFLGPVLMFAGNFISTLPITYLLQITTLPASVRESFNRRNIVNQLLFTYSIEAVVQIFAILAAAIYVGLSAELYFLYIVGFVIISVGSNKLSEAVEYNRQRSVELGKLEALGRALLDSPPDGSDLKNVLSDHVSDMFFRGLMEIRRFPDEVLLHNFAHVLDWETGEVVWHWFLDNPETHIFYGDSRLPWTQELPDSPIILVPILDRATSRMIGGIWLGIGDNKPSEKRVNATLAALRSLSDQIASALHSAEAYKQRLAHEKTKQELAFAGRIQASFLPDDVPQVGGWELCAVIEPANQTSGDFYDFIDLPGGKLGIVVADVADKGTGAALFMALSRTLLRTYAHEYPDSPAETFTAVNSRILGDTRSGQFVTVFYGILDPIKGTFTYASAGHNPAYLLNGEVHELKRTGIPLGMLEDARWKEQTITLPPDLPLVMYT
ncbi:MAG: SpoIIE family protein phosphatase, partial [Chloroflexi bacterium]|nr:SpoIIE family protein phosphatase [Chloroflexota bacterium]